ncbi:MAG: glutathione S-transferase family protein [Pseudomonadota bacterium]|nr:glutathione S-transferase family protein [Pseudomonadota bacterium]
MFQLYHHGSSVCAAKVRLVLEEKDVEYEKHYLDILKGDQFNPDYLKINPKGVVPTLIHDEKTIFESSVINEYLEWVIPNSVKLIPDDHAARANMLYWTKWVDEELHPACGTITFMSSHRYTINKMSKEKVEEFLNNTPQLSLASDWKARKRRYVEEGLADPDAHKAIVVHEITLDKMETALNDNKYVAGDNFTLADIALIPYLNRLYMLSMLGNWCKDKPNTLDWFNRMRTRKSFFPAIDKYLPEDLANDLKTNGAKSWPDVKNILDLALESWRKK